MCLHRLGYLSNFGNCCCLYWSQRGLDLETAAVSLEVIPLCDCCCCYFLKVLGDKISSKRSQNCLCLFGLFWKTSLLCKNCCGYFLGNKIWSHYAALGSTLNIQNIFYKLDFVALPPLQILFILFFCSKYFLLNCKKRENLFAQKTIYQTPSRQSSHNFLSKSMMLFGKNFYTFFCLRQ